MRTSSRARGQPGVCPQPFSSGLWPREDRGGPRGLSGAGSQERGGTSSGCCLRGWLSGYLPRSWRLHVLCRGPRGRRAHRVTRVGSAVSVTCCGHQAGKGLGMRWPGSPLAPVSLGPPLLPHLRMAAPQTPVGKGVREGAKQRPGPREPRVGRRPGAPVGSMQVWSVQAAKAPGCRCPWVPSALQLRLSRAPPSGPVVCGCAVLTGR